MAESNKCSIHSGLESDFSATGAEIPSISDQPASTTNTGYLEESPEDTKTENTPKDMGIDSPPKSLPLLPVPPSSHQDRCSLPTALSLPPPTHQSEHSSPTNLTTSVVQTSFSTTSRNEPEKQNSPAQLELESDESSESKAEVPVIHEKPHQTVSTSNEEQPAEFSTETMPKLIDNTSSAIAEQLPVLLPTVHQHGQDMQEYSAMERAPTAATHQELNTGAYGVATEPFNMNIITFGHSRAYNENGARRTCGANNCSRRTLIHCPACRLSLCNYCYEPYHLFLNGL